MTMSGELGRLPEDLETAPTDMSGVSIPGNVDHEGMAM